MSEPNYRTTKFSTENVLTIEIKNTKVLMNKPVYLGLSIVGLSKILIYQFCYQRISVISVSFTKETNKINLSLSDDKRMQSIDLKETYAYGTSKELVCKKGEIKCNNIIKQYKNV